MDGWRKESKKIPLGLYRDKEGSEKSTEREVKVGEKEA